MILEDGTFYSGCLDQPGLFPDSSSNNDSDSSKVHGSSDESASNGGDADPCDSDEDSGDSSGADDDSNDEESNNENPVEGSNDDKDPGAAAAEVSTGFMGAIDNRILRLVNTFPAEEEKPTYSCSTPKFPIDGEKPMVSTQRLGKAANFLIGRDVCGAVFDDNARAEVAASGLHDASPQTTEEELAAARDNANVAIDVWNEWYRVSPGLASMMAVAPPSLTAVTGPPAPHDLASMNVTAAPPDLNAVAAPPTPPDLASRASMNGTAAPPGLTNWKTRRRRQPHPEEHCVHVPPTALEKLHYDLMFDASPGLASMSARAENHNVPPSWLSMTAGAATPTPPDLSARAAPPTPPDVDSMDVTATPPDLTAGSAPPTPPDLAITSVTAVSPDLANMVTAASPTLTTEAAPPTTPDLGSTNVTSAPPMPPGWSIWKIRKRWQPHRPPWQRRGNKVGAKAAPHEVRCFTGGAGTSPSGIGGELTWLARKPLNVVRASEELEFPPSGIGGELVWLAHKPLNAVRAPEELYMAGVHTGAADRAPDQWARAIMCAANERRHITYARPIRAA